MINCFDNLSTLKQLSKTNKLLNSEENLAIYNILYYARINDKKLTSTQILDNINNRYGCEISNNKIWRTLEVFIDKGIIHKDINHSPHKYYLDKIIYTPSRFTPVPSYQIILLFLNVPFLIYAHFTSHQIIFNLLLGSLFGILAIMLIHHTIFEITNERHYAKKLIEDTVLKVRKIVYEVDTYRKSPETVIELLREKIHLYQSVKFLKL